MGYIFTKLGDEFNVALKDIPYDSEDNVFVKCDYCGEALTVKYKRYNESIKKFGDYACSHCTQKRTLKERQNNMYGRILAFCDNYGYTLVTQKEELTSRESVVKYICPIHGENTTKATSILQDKKCYQCSRVDAGIHKWEHSADDRSENYYAMALEKCSELGYELLSSIGDITSFKSDVAYKCPIHGEHKMKFGNLINGKHCPDCSNAEKVALNKLPIDEVISKVELCGSKVLNPEEYINQKERNLKILCPRCGQPFVTSLILFTQHGGQVCEKCYRKESVGERNVRRYLENNGIPFRPQAWFPDCRDIKPLPFDFYLYTLNTIIEFDGSQHSYDAKHFFHKSYNHETCIKHDKIKNEYCSKNGIKLIRIPYWKINSIPEILDKELNYSHEDIV